jgi:hypothetical protein
LRFLDLLDRRWPEPALLYLIFPVAVFLNLFAAALFVFFFGIFTPFLPYPIYSYPLEKSRKLHY